jgi:hypothetical protein
MESSINIIIEMITYLFMSIWTKNFIILNMAKLI